MASTEDQAVNTTDPLYLGRGFWSWLLQRLTGLFLTYFIGVHIFALHFGRTEGINVADVIDRLRDSPSMGVFYFGFVGTVIFHALNGVRGIALDFAPSPSGRRLVQIILWCIGLFAFGYGIFVLGALTRLE